MSKFHWRDGWYFERTEDGSVAMTVPPRQAGRIKTIPPNEWASIVASVTPEGDNAETFAAAERLHKGTGI